MAGNESEWSTSKPTDPGAYWGCNRHGEVGLFMISSIPKSGVDEATLYSRLVGGEQSGWLHTGMFAGYQWQRIEKPMPPKKPMSAEEFVVRAAIATKLRDDAAKLETASGYHAAQVLRGHAAAIERGE